MEQADAARSGLREQLQESNEKMITLEEDLYEQKQINRDLVKQVKDLQKEIDINKGKTMQKKSLFTEPNERSFGVKSEIQFLDDYPRSRGGHAHGLRDQRS